MNNRKNIIIDCQILQTDAWFRGMGRYMQQILHQLSTLASEDFNIFLVFNNSIKCDSLRFETLKFMCPNATQIYLDLPLANNRLAKGKDYKQALDNLITSKFKNQNNYYLIASLFMVDFFAIFPDQCTKLLLIYDVIPLLFWSELGGYFPPHLYMERFNQIYQADLIFSISETVKNDLLNIFGLDKNNIININGGFSKNHFKAKPPEDLKINFKYILMPTGDLPHKNNEIAVDGFQKFNETIDNKLKLLITSTFSDKTKRKLLNRSKNIIFTGNISDEELNWLYINAESVLFASKYEGLGIPILDAVENNKPIVTSRISVFEEMTVDGFYFFNPFDSQSLAAALNNAFKKKNYSIKHKNYKSILDKYTWGNTAKSFMNAIINLNNMDIVSKNDSSKPKLGIVCINPGIDNQIGRITEPLLVSISNKYLLKYYFDSKNMNITEFERPTFLDYINNVETFDLLKLDLITYKANEITVIFIDKQCLKNKIAQIACVLPALIIYDFKLSELDKSERLIADTIFKFQKYKCKFDKQASRDIIIKDITKMINNYYEFHRVNNITEYEKIIRRRLPNKSIMKRLIRRIDEV